MKTLLFLITSLLFSTTLSAICFLGEKTPTKAEIDQDTQIYKNLWIKVEDAPLLDCYNDNGKKIETVRFQERYRVASGHYAYRDNGEKWYLLIKGNSSTPLKKEEILGWVNERFVLANRSPLKNNFDIYQKVLVNKGLKNGGNLLPIYLNQKLEGRSEDNIGVRTIFYVYDYYPPEKDPVQAESLLISVEREFAIFKDKEPLLLGWIDRKMVTFWDTRTALEFPTHKETVIFNEDNEQIGLVKDPRPLQHDELRSPILENKGDFYKVGVFFKLNKKQLKLKERIQAVKTGLEVLFIIDGTRSMQMALDNILKAVSNTSKSLNKEAKVNGYSKPKFGIALYRDKPNPKALPKTKKNRKVNIKKHPECVKEIDVKELGSLEKFQKILKKQIACDQDFTREESVLYGLSEGIRKAGFKQGIEGKSQKLRIIIHIGDAGDNQNGPSYIEAAKVIKKYNIHQYVLIDLSPKKNLTKSMLPVFEQLRQYNQLKIDQLSLLPAKVEQRLRKTFINLNKKAKNIQEQINIISRGFAGTTEGVVGIISKEVQKIAIENIEANNINLQDFDIYQHYVEGWVKKAPLMKEELFVTLTHLEDLIAQLKTLNSTQRPEDRKQLWGSTMQTFIGEGESCIRKNSNGQYVESLEECIKKHHGIPIKASFMKYSLAEFLNLGDQQAPQVACEAEQVIEKFRTLFKNILPYKIILLDKNDCKFRLKTRLDINGDGFINRDGTIFKTNSDGSKGNVFQPSPQDNIPEDKYFYHEPQSVAWIPLAHF